MIGQINHYKSQYAHSELMTDTIPNIIGMARRAGLDAAADRLDYLYNLPVENGDDPMNPETARLLVVFLSEHPELTTCAITVDPEGYVSASWDITQDSELDAKFLPSGNVWFTYVAGDDEYGNVKIFKTGDTSPDNMLKEIMPLIKR